jgi:signal transduction histidine kinase
MVTALVSLLPRGVALPTSVWSARHRFMLRVAGLQVPFLLVVGLANHSSPIHVLVETALIGLLVAAGLVSRRRLGQAMFTSLALLSSSATLVHLTDGLIESHFHFFVTLPLIALYQDWRPFLSSVVFVAAHHGIAGYLSPTDVFNHPAALASPIKWAFIHAGYVLSLVAVLVFQWRSAERSQMALRDSEASLQRANRILRAVSECSDALVRATDEGGLLKEVCRIVVARGDYTMCWAGLANAETGSIRPVATGGLDDSYVQSLPLLWLGEGRGDGPAVRAVRTRSPVTVADIATDPNFEPWRERALERGYRSMIAVPFEYGDAVLGLLAVYAGETAAFDEAGVTTLQRFADDLAYGIAALRNRDQRQAAERKLRETLRSKDELIATIAHELRTPLTSVVGFASLLRDEGATLSAEDRAELIHIVADEGMDLSNIVDDLLVAAKVEAGTLRLSSVGVDLRGQAAQVLERWEPEAISHVEFTGSSVRTLGDPARVRQILRNLISNALRYGGRQVRVEVTADEQFARVTVRDDGPGVGEGDSEAIFEPYQRGNNAPGLTASMGLGLTISRQLARLMNGDLTYRRQADETVFELTLPARAEHPTTDIPQPIERADSERSLAASP